MVNYDRFADFHLLPKRRCGAVFENRAAWLSRFPVHYNVTSVTSHVGHPGAINLSF